jgi:Tol biopolymer transport system component
MKKPEWILAPVALAILLVLVLGLVLTASNPAQTKDAEPASRKPVMFGRGVISTAEYDFGGCFTPDGKSFYFARTVPVGRAGAIYVSHFVQGKWRAPEVVEFSGQYIDYDPFVAADGNRLYFDSNRPVDGRPKRDFDIWYVDKTSTGWSAPQRLDAPINTSGQEFYPSIAADGTLYFSSTRPGGKGGMDLYRSRLIDGKYSEPETLGVAINTASTEVDSIIAPDQSFIVFASNRADSLGDLDLYLSRKEQGVWTPAKNLGPPINSIAKEYCPGLSQDGKYLLFTSEIGWMDQPDRKRLDARELQARLRGPGNGFGDIYLIAVSALAPQTASGQKTQN